MKLITCWHKRTLGDGWFLEEWENGTCTFVFTDGEGKTHRSPPFQAEEKEATP